MAVISEKGEKFYRGEDKLEYYNMVKKEADYCFNPDCILCHRRKNNLSEMYYNYIYKDSSAGVWNKLSLDTILGNKKVDKSMSVVDKIKKLTLSNDDRLLQKFGLKDHNNQWTDDATEVLDQLLLDERKADLVEKVKQLEAEEKKGKK